MRASRRVLAAALLLALAAPATVLADYRAYARGQEAAADGDWAQVEQEMQKALAANPDPKVRVKLYGQRFAPYVPQYYLGLAAYRQNDCAAAMRWFGDAAAASVIAQVPEFRGVADAARGDCNAKLAANKPVTEKPPITPDRPTTDKPVPDKPVVQVPPVTNKPVPPAATPDKPVPVTTPSTPVVPAALQTALQQWLAGRYRDVVAGGTNGLQGKALAHLHLLRASAYFAQSEVDPANAAALRASAAQEVRDARRAQAAIAPDAGFHSPRFRAFFAATR